FTAAAEPGRPVMAARPTGGTRPTNEEARRQLLAAADAEIGAGWRRWEAADWLRHFDDAQSRGRPMPCYVFDFSCTPELRADAGGFAEGQGRLMLISVQVCPDCSRPVIAIFRRRTETPIEMRADIRARLQEAEWHTHHP